MLTIMDREDNESKNKALIATLLFHGCIVVLLLFLTLKPPYPLPKEVSVEVSMADLGSTLDGQGNVTPDKIAEPTSDAKQQNDFNAQPVTDVKESPRQVVTDDASDTQVNTTDKAVKVPQDTDSPKPDEIKPVEKKVNTRAIYAGSKNTNSGSSTGGSEGSGEGLGDRGSPDGTPGGKGILGNGSGTWELNGRSLVREASIETTREEGTVVLKIWVDRRGNVFKAEPILAQCTTTSEYLFDLAKKAAMQHQYNARPEAAPEQVGKMTFKFILK